MRILKGSNRHGSLNINSPFRFEWRPEIEQLGKRRQMIDGMAHLQEPMKKLGLNRLRLRSSDPLLSVDE